MTLGENIGVKNHEMHKNAANACVVQESALEAMGEGAEFVPRTDCCTKKSVNCHGAAKTGSYELKLCTQLVCAMSERLHLKSP